MIAEEQSVFSYPVIRARWISLWGRFGGFGQRGGGERKCSCSQQGAVELQLCAYVSV